METQSKERTTGLFQALQITPTRPGEAERLLRHEIDRKLAADPRLSAHFFTPQTENSEERAAAVVAFRKAWDCEVGDLTMDSQIVESLRMHKLLPRQAEPKPPAYIRMETRQFEPRTVRFGEEKVTVWERVEAEEPPKGEGNADG